MSRPEESIYEVIDTRRSRWPTALRSALRTRRPLLLILPKGPEAAVLLDWLFGVNLAGDGVSRDRITFYDFSRHLKHHQHRSLAVAHATSFPVVLIEELHLPFARRGGNSGQFICGLVRSLSWHEQNLIRPIGVQALMGQSVNSADFLEMDVRVCQLNETALNELTDEWSRLRVPIAALPELPLTLALRN